MDRERKETQKQRTAGEEPVFNDVVRSDNSRRAREARFDGFGPLSGQNGPPEGEQGAQPSRPSWRGPFWRIWAAQRTKRSTRERQGQRPSTFSPASLDTEVVPVSALSFPGCLLAAVAFCEILSGYTGFLAKFSDHFLPGMCS